MTKRERSTTYDKVLVILVDAYGSTEDYQGMEIDAKNLTEEEMEILYRSGPDAREKYRNLAGCGGDDFTGFWSAVPEGNIAKFSEKYHCKVILAYLNE